MKGLIIFSSLIVGLVVSVNLATAQTTTPVMEGQGSQPVMESHGSLKISHAGSRTPLLALEVVTSAGVTLPEINSGLSDNLEDGSVGITSENGK